MSSQQGRKVDAVHEAPPLRAKGLGKGKLRLASRIEAREANVAAFRKAAEGTSNSELGAEIGGELAAAQAREGAVVLTPGEVVLLLPLGVASRAVFELMRERLVRELARTDVPADVALRLSLALNHVHACLVCLAG